jgi:hypothetical protein
MGGGTSAIRPTSVAERSFLSIVGKVLQDPSVSDRQSTIANMCGDLSKLNPCLRCCWARMAEACRTLLSPLSPPTCNLNQSKRRTGAGSTRAAAGWTAPLRTQESSLSEPPSLRSGFRNFAHPTLRNQSSQSAVWHTTFCSLPDKLVANVRRSHFSSPLPRASHSLDYFVFRKQSSAVLPGTHTISLPYQLLSRIFTFGPSFGVSNLDLIGSSLHP